jgi:galactose-1-phosphate uridylyltransferase
MPIEFKSIKTKHRLFNPLKQFALDEMPLEIRFDPLTGQTGRVLDTGYRIPAPPDLSALIRRSREIFCPFCSETLEKSTPLYPEEVIPGGRIRSGRATLIPNLLPLDKYAAVSVFSEEHYIPLDGFSPDVMRDAFAAALTFIGHVLDFDPAVQYCSVNWNYMPPAGSSLVHPHIQVNCGEIATNHQRWQLEGSRSYREENGADFWRDFMKAEIENELRYIGTMGDTFWTLNFVPLAYLPDVLCLFPRLVSAAQLEEETLLNFLTGLSRILLYFHSRNIHSFNLALLSLRQGEYFRMNARVSPRLLTRDIGNSDQTYSHTLHRETYCMIPPESVSREVRRAFLSGVID